MTNLERAFSEFGQSIWLDNLGRHLLRTGELEQLVKQGVRGVTSNPSIFQQSIENSDDYTADFDAAMAESLSVEDAYWRLVKADITTALSILRPVYDESGCDDGFISLEVSPKLAHDTAVTIESAKQLHSEINQPNLMVKIPATSEGLPAIKQMISEGKNINITLIFSLSRYQEVIEAYLSGLEARSGDLSSIHSVASFFVSRVDTEVDKRLEAKGANKEISGKAALAQAVLAYELFKKSFSGPRWEALVARGANLQRPLWASTSTKNPAYPDLLYVDNLCWPDTVNTLPNATIDAFLDHGSPIQLDLDKALAESRNVLDQLDEAGIDMADVSQVLETEGVAKFTQSYDQLLRALEAKKPN